MKSSLNFKCVWCVLPLCLLLIATGLTSCNSSLESDLNQDWLQFSFFDFSKTMDDTEANLIEKDELPEWLIPIVSEREEMDPSTAVFTAEMGGQLVYNIYYFSKEGFSVCGLSNTLKYVDLYYTDGTPVPFKSGPESEIAFSPEKWRMIYCAHPELYRQQRRQELMEKDELPDWLVNKIDSCTSVVVTLLTRDDQQAYSVRGSLKPVFIREKSVLIGTYFPDGSRCTHEEDLYFGRSTDQCIIYLQE